MKKICVTGANGFIGSSICKTLSSLGEPVKGFVRKLYPSLKTSGVEYQSVGDICSDINWKDQLNGYDYVIHCAGKAHVMNKNDDPNIYRLANVESTRRIAEDAVKAGVKRLIFLSTVKVNGESKFNTYNNKIITIEDKPNPQDEYARSKLEAENILLEISARTDLEVVIVRLPLVYGHGVKGNLAKLIQLIKTGIPLPFSLVKNQRSMIGINNLVDMLLACIEHPNAAEKTFLVSDGKDLSTRELIKLIASSMDSSSKLFPVPISLLRFVSKIIGKEDEINRLLGSFQVDTSYTREILNWKPTISVEEEIREMVQFL
jgi:nucleoside-diphosphate-sugar epimerase